MWTLQTPQTSVEMMGDYLTPSSGTLSRYFPHKDDPKDTESQILGMPCSVNTYDHLVLLPLLFLSFPFREELWTPEDKWPTGNTQEDSDGQRQTAEHLASRQWAPLMPA